MKVGPQAQHAVGKGYEVGMEGGEEEEEEEEEEGLLTNNE